MNQITLTIAAFLIVIILTVLFTVIKKLKETKTSLKESIIKNNEYKNKFTEYFNTEEECNLLIKKWKKKKTK